jgi:chromosome segregation ATPase
MAQRNSSDFNFRIGKYDRPEILLDVRSVSHRITIITILILCLVGLAFGFGYFNMKKRFSEVHNTGAVGLENISRNLESRFSSLSIQQAKFQDSFSQQAASLEKKIENLKAYLKNIEKQLAAIGASKPNRKDLELTVLKMSKNIAPIQQKVNQLASDQRKLVNQLASDQKKLMNRLEARNKKRDRELTHTASALAMSKKSLDELKEELESLSVRKIDKYIFEMQFKNEQKVYQKALNQLTRKFETRVKRLEGKIRSLEKTGVPKASTSLRSPNPPDKSTADKPIKIEEQSIKQ